LKGRIAPAIIDLHQGIGDDRRYRAEKSLWLAPKFSGSIGGGYAGIPGLSVCDPDDFPLCSR